MCKIIIFPYHCLGFVLPLDTSPTLFFFAPSFSRLRPHKHLIFFSYHDIVHHYKVSRAVSSSPGLYPKLYFSVYFAHFISPPSRYLQTHISKSATLFLYSARVAVYTLCGFILFSNFHCCKIESSFLNRDGSSLHEDEHCEEDG